MFQQDNSDLLSAIMAKKGFQELLKKQGFYSTETTVNARDMTTLHHKNSCPDYNVHMTSHALEKPI